MDIDYEIIDTSNESHQKCLKEIWEDKSIESFFDTFERKRSFENFLSSFNNEDTMLSERLVKIKDNLVAWIRAFRKENTLILTCIVLKRYRGMGIGRSILKEIIDKNSELDILVEIRKDNYISLRTLKSFDFNLEGKTDDGFLIYRRSFKHLISSQN